LSEAIWFKKKICVSEPWINCNPVENWLKHKVPIHEILYKLNNCIFRTQQLVPWRFALVMFNCIIKTFNKPWADWKWLKFNFCVLHTQHH
jgi:hypothetical protein